MPESTSSTSKIRPMVYADLDRVLAWRNHPDVRRYMFNQHEITLDEHEHWFERTVQDPCKHALIFETGNQPLGFVNFNELSKGGIFDWSFHIAPDAPKGSGRRLGETALNYAFLHLKLHKVCGQVLAYNEHSIRFHQTLGFQQEGMLREQYFDGDRYSHVICFGLLSHEWDVNL